MKIESLTKEQEGRLDEFRDKWLKIGLCTDLADFEECKAAAIDAYKEAGLEPPTNFYLFDGPQSAAKGILKLEGKKETKEDIRNKVSEMSFGCHDAGWLSFYDYFYEVCGLEVCAKLRPLNRLAMNCGWWSAYEDTAVFQHRPAEIHLDENNLLHNENGPAVKYRDGFTVYAWRGTRIPSEWIEDKASLKPETAITWPNMEQRRAASEIVGWVNVLEQLDARTIDKHDNPMVGELVEVDIPDIGRERFLRVQCGTNRLFALPVPPEMETAEQSQRWLNFIPDEISFIPEKRT